MKIEVYDTTLRDGSQGERVSFSLEDKFKIVHKLDDFGFDYIECGWPGSNPKDEEFFQKSRKLRLNKAKITAFGSTCRAGAPASNDKNLQKLLESETEIITLFGKSWDLHVQKVLRISLSENLNLISDSIAYLRKQGRRVFFDAEHFFDGYRENPEYALKSIRAAEEAGAERIVLCDTNGGFLPNQITAALTIVKKKVKTPLGIHTHNDGGLAVANTLTAVNAGAVQIQGTVNGL
ncbi:MAG: citramalate synthase, partial [Candidatus Omnitrophica bacterium]|nr:citramalate synthase [Candidatus Omnitrophota bacterium]